MNEFDSNRKRMSVLVQFPNKGGIYLILKGADSVVWPRLKSEKNGISFGKIRKKKRN